MTVFIYAVLVFLVLRFSVTLFNFLSNPKLGYYGKRFTDRVCIVISGDKIDAAPLLDSLKKQDYENTEVFFQQEEKFSINELSGKYLLFLDGKTIIKKGLLNNLIFRIKVFDLDLLSLIPNRRIKSLRDWCVLPVNDFVLLNLFPLRYVKLNSQLAFSIASEACLFYTAESYRQKIRNERSNDLPIMLKTEVLLANRFIYLDERADFEKSGQLLLKTFGNNFPAMLIYILLLVAGPVFMVLDYQLTFQLLPFGLIFLSRIMISFLTRQNVLINLLLHPVQLTVLLILGWKLVFSKLFTSVVHKV